MSIERELIQLSHKHNSPKVNPVPNHDQFDLVMGSNSRQSLTDKNILNSKNVPSFDKVLEEINLHNSNFENYDNKFFEAFNQMNPDQGINSNHNQVNHHQMAASEKVPSFSKPSSVSLNSSKSVNIHVNHFTLNPKTSTTPKPKTTTRTMIKLTPKQETSTNDPIKSSS